jgi:hypothetical protein
LHGGQVVLTGTLVDPAWLAPGVSQATIEVERLGRASVRLV